MLSTIDRHSNLERVQLISSGALDALNLGMAAVTHGVHALLSFYSCASSIILGRKSS